MPIPEHVKRQAMDAINHRETTAMIRAAKTSGMAVSPEDLFSHYQKPTKPTVPISEEVKRHAMDAISHPETQTQIRLARFDGLVTSPVTPAWDRDGRVGRQSPDRGLPPRNVTPDGFERD